MTIRTLSVITINLSFFLMWWQGFIEKAQERTEMFTQKQISQIFGNISEIYDVAQQFLKQLETAVSDSESAVHNALIGKCFLDHVSCTWSEQLLKFFLYIPMVFEVVLPPANCGTEVGDPHDMAQHFPQNINSLPNIQNMLESSLNLFIWMGPNIEYQYWRADAFKMIIRSIHLHTCLIYLTGVASVIS